jgi:hypothetical protein
MNRLVGLVLVLLVVAWFVPSVRPLVALCTLVLIGGGRRSTTSSSCGRRGEQGAGSDR